MNSKTRLVFLLVAAVCWSDGRNLRAQKEKESPDADLAKMMDVANQMQKEAEKTNPAGDANKPKKSMAELQEMAKQQTAAMERSEKLRKEKMDAALKKQLAAPGPVEFPAWAPKFPEMKADGPVARKIIDEQVCTILSGTSPLTPAQLGDAWEKEKTDKINISRSNNIFNDLKQVIIYVQSRESDDGEVRMEAERRADDKVTRIKITSPLPKPEVEEDE